MSRGSFDVDIPIECPHCGQTMKKPLSQLSKKDSVTCRCGQVFTLKGNGFKSAKKGLDGLEKSIKKMNKTINIRI